MRDQHGVSTCESGREKHETFWACGQTFVQYDYRDVNGELFSCVGWTVYDCRRRREEWQQSRLTG